MSVHIERATLPYKAAFEPEKHRKHYTMPVMYGNKRMRYVIRLRLAEAPGRPPFLVGTTDQHSVIEEPVKVVENWKDKEGVEHEIKRTEWQPIVHACDHPVLGTVIVIVEPSMIWDGEEWRWEEDVELTPQEIRDMGLEHHPLGTEEIEGQEDS